MPRPRGNYSPDSPKALAFCEEYLVDGNAKAAATRAGYSPRSAKWAGAALIAQDAVQARIQTLRAARSARTLTDADWVIATLKENVERAMQARAVLDREGSETGEYQYDGAVANRALELIGKHHGLFDRAKLQVNVDLDKLTDAQLEHLATGGTLDGMPT